MLSLRDFQSEFGSAVLGGDGVLANVRAAEPIPLESRVNVYRNNVYASLIDGLEKAFPVVLQLVGQEFFRAMAREYLRDNMPARGTLIGFGAAMPEFLDGFPPVSSLPYLSDVARFELAWLRSYHAADEAPLTPDAISAVPQAYLGDVKFVLHPSLQTLQSAHPVVSLWQAHQPGQDPGAMNVNEGGEAALLLRSNLSVVVHQVERGALVFVDALRSGETFGVAATAAQNLQGDFDLSHILHLLLSGGGFARLIRS
ncbi:DNA-binding domain-containing protein [Parvibaculaceae bacterium PLY_AMNH_Bact1]|nr:DNA-binding domain-containing protein [Parvibaculaceae bacterium PLY_AMNH_Bact1]